MTASEDIVSVSGLYKRFGKVEALNGLTLHSRPGIIGLIGPNGAGKTTLLRILLGLLRPDSGNARILGHDVIHESLEVRKKVGVLHEKAFFPPSMTPSDYLNAVNRLYRTDGSVDELLSLVGLSHASDRKIKHLSAGMHQRLGLAQALCGEPELVFLDEPTSYLDVGGRDDVVSLIVRVHQESGVSFFISSHILSELERACHTVAFVRSGQVVDFGPVDELVRKHTKNRFQVTISDPKKLSKILEQTSGISDVLIVGSASIIVEVSPDQEGDIELLINRVAEKNGIEVYRIDPTGTLEDVYRKVNRSG